MVDFVAHKYDVLLATTIIENGLDIPNANTIVINRADRYGLSQLYQLRGRVGRSDRRAYAYLLIPPEDALSPVAKKRLAAIREFSDLGQRLPRRGARPGDPWRRQPPRRRAERPHRGRRLRHVHEAARTDDQGAEGRGDRGRRPRDRQPARGPADRRGLHPRHESAADRLPPDGGGPLGGRIGPGPRGAPRPLRPAAGHRSRIWPITRASGCWPIASASNRSTAKPRSSS